MTANVAVFAVSAFFHELLISVPCHVLRLWAFLAMMCVYLCVCAYTLCTYVASVWSVAAVVGWCICVCIVLPPLGIPRHDVRVRTECVYICACMISCRHGRSDHIKQPPQPPPPHTKPTQTPHPPPTHKTNTGARSPSSTSRTTWRRRSFARRRRATSPSGSSSASSASPWRCVFWFLCLSLSS